MAGGRDCILCSGSSCSWPRTNLKPESMPNFSLSAGVLRYKMRVWLDHDKNLHAQVIAGMHSSALGLGVF
jgi:hypothetical protein